MDDPNKRVTYIGKTKVTATFDHYTPEMYWENRWSLFCDNIKRMKTYEKMAYEDIELLKDRVRNALEGMYDTVEDWLPTGFKDFEPGNRIVIEFEMLVLDIDKELKERDKAISFKARAAREAIQRQLEEDELEDEA